MILSQDKSACRIARARTKARAISLAASLPQSVPDRWEPACRAISSLAQHVRIGRDRYAGCAPRLTRARDTDDGQRFSNSAHAAVPQAQTEFLSSSSQTFGTAFASVELFLFDARYTGNVPGDAGFT